jgi:hypothetical protein
MLAVPSFANPVAPKPVIPNAEPANTLDVLIRLVSLGTEGGQLQLWIEGDRLGNCNLPLEIVERSRLLEEQLTEIRIRVFHIIPTDSDCAGEYVSFTAPFRVNQAIEPGNTYQFWVNDYNFTLERE